VAVALAAALDDWAAVRRYRKRDRTGATALAKVARTADPDPWRNRLRDALDRPGREALLAALRGLAAAAPFESLGPVSLDLLGRVLDGAGDPVAAEAVLRRAQRQHPDDVWINYDPASALGSLARREEAIRYYTAARALEPRSAHALAHALQSHGDPDEAIAVFEDLRRHSPHNARHLNCLGEALQARGRSREASAAFGAATVTARAAIAARPEDSNAHEFLGLVLSRQGKREELIAEYRTAIRMRPNDADLYNNFGLALDRLGRLEDAMAKWRTAVSIQPNHPFAHRNLGFALSWLGKQDEAVAEFRTAIRIRSTIADAHNGIGWAWSKLPDPTPSQIAEGLEHARKAVALEPSDGRHHNTLALAAYRAGSLDESIAAAERSIELLRSVPLSVDSDAYNWFFLAMACGRRGETDRARGYFERAVARTRERDPRNVELLQFWREAAAVLDRPGPDAAAPARLRDLPADVFAP
jgi:superkiller protein 3